MTPFQVETLNEFDGLDGFDDTPAPALPPLPTAPTGISLIAYNNFVTPLAKLLNRADSFPNAPILISVGILGFWAALFGAGYYFGKRRRPSS